MWCHSASLRELPLLTPSCLHSLNDTAMMINQGKEHIQTSRGFSLTLWRDAFGYPIVVTMNSPEADMVGTVSRMRRRENNEAAFRAAFRTRTPASRAKSGNGPAIRLLAIPFEPRVR